MKTQRLFLAINLPENIKNKLLIYQRQWEDLPARKVPKSNLHITLIFLGDTGNDQMYNTIKISEHIAKKHKPFKINLQRIILGPPNKPPRMIWVEGKRNQEIASLKNDLENALLNLENSNYIKKETRAYKPHITLGRIKTGQWKKLENPPKINKLFDFNVFVDSIELMQSNLKRTGAEYAVLESINLGL